MTSEASHWYCPLYRNEISAGRCLDINYERVGLLNGRMFEQVTEATGIKEPEISNTCINCPNQPLKEENPTSSEEKSEMLQLDNPESTDGVRHRP
jgi:hypothetical protein